MLNDHCNSVYRVTAAARIYFGAAYGFVVFIDSVTTIYTISYNIYNTAFATNLMFLKDIKS
jgi:hypothetical protein